eukprot:scaffold136514_cov26-Tisochrysis_lutea.AAC.3
MGDTVLDMGGYRTFDTISPRTQFLITERLGLSLGCYDPISCLGKVIVDGEGNRIGFVTFLEKMLEEITELGVRYFPGHAVTSLERAGEDYLVNVAALPFPIAASRVILAVPQYPLQQPRRRHRPSQHRRLTSFARALPQILRASPTVEVGDDLYTAIHSLQPVHAVKFYLYYEDAWWITKLGLEEGGFTAEGNAVSPPLEGRYHDGDIKCNADKTSCHGWLQTQYFWDFSGRTQNYFARFQKSRDSPVTMMSEISDGAKAIADVHAKVLQYHNLSPQEVPPPIEGALVTWNLATPFANTGWHYWTDATKVNDLQQFLSDQRLHLVNEAFSATPSWAEGAILMADTMIEDLFGIPPPHDPVDYLARNYISETWADAPQSAGFPDICENTCTRIDTGEPFPGFVGNGACNDGGEGSSVIQVCEYGTDCADCGPRSMAGGPGGAVAEDPACFLGNARLLLADDSRIPISEAKVGMRVKSSFGVGTITEVLKHPIHDYVRRFRLPTEHGHLVGTLDHPIFVDGRWLEAGEAHREGHLPKMQVEYEIVDYFWNLEVDGSAAEGESHHAYDVNGVTVSGLGDNPRLNAIYQRQNAFKATPAAVAMSDSPVLSDAKLETRGITSGATTVHIAAVFTPVLDLNTPPHNMKRCPAWDHIADGSQTCGSKVQWWMNAYRYDIERAMLAVSQRFRSCASCRPTNAPATAPMSMPMPRSITLSESNSATSRRRIQAGSCTVESLCPSPSPPTSDTSCDDAICGGEDDECDEYLCGDDVDECDEYLCGDDVDECDEYLCGDGDPCDAALCDPEPPLVVVAHPPSPPSPNAEVSPPPTAPAPKVESSPPPAPVDIEAAASRSLLVPILVPLLIAAVLLVAGLGAFYYLKTHKAGSISVKSAAAVKAVDTVKADAPSTSGGDARVANSV